MSVRDRIRLHPPEKRLTFRWMGTQQSFIYLFVSHRFELITRASTNPLLKVLLPLLFLSLLLDLYLDKYSPIPKLIPVPTLLLEDLEL